MKSKQKKFIAELIGGLVIIAMFFLLLNKYYDVLPGQSAGPKLNPRFAVIDTALLVQEANSLIISKPSTKQNAESVIVLTYHVVSNHPPSDDYEISYDQFKDNMFALKSRGYQTVSLDDFNLFLSGKKDIPDKSFLITFDDGAKAAYYNADPILKVLNYTAVMFVITGQSFDGESPYYLNESELMDAHLTGRWELESHTHKSHFRLAVNSEGDVAPALTNKLWFDNRLETDKEFYDRVDNDLVTSKTILEKEFNKKVTAFALPYGDFGERGSNYEKAHNVVHDLTAANFKLIFYEFPIKDIYYRGNYVDNNQDLHIISRIAADKFRTPESLLNKIEATTSIKLPYIEDYANNDRWPRLSGVATFENNLITLKSNSENSQDTILMAYLDGSYLWKDYTYSIQLVNKETSTISLLSRLTVNADYVYCQYNDEKITLVKTTNGVREKVKIVTMPEKISLKEGTKLSMSVKGTLVTCSVNAEKILNANIPEISPIGGVGIKMEDYTTGNLTFSFGNVTIIPLGKNEK